MKPVTMKEAGDLVGASKSTIYRAVKSGKLSSSTDDEGVVLIDPSELARVYPDFNPVGARSSTIQQIVHETADSAGPGVSAVSDDVSDAPQPDSVRTKYITTVSLLKAQKQINETLSDQVDDLKIRLDQSESERRRKDAQVTALLTDQSQRIRVEKPGFWSRVFG